MIINNGNKNCNNRDRKTNKLLRDIRHYMKKLIQFKHRQKLKNSPKKLMITKKIINNIMKHPVIFYHNAIKMD